MPRKYLPKLTGEMHYPERYGLLLSQYHESDYEEDEGEADCRVRVQDGWMCTKCGRGTEKCLCSYMSNLCGCAEDEECDCKDEDESDFHEEEGCYCGWFKECDCEEDEECDCMLVKECVCSEDEEWQPSCPDDEEAYGDKEPESSDHAQFSTNPAQNDDVVMKSLPPSLLMQCHLEDSPSGSSENECMETDRESPTQSLSPPSEYMDLDFGLNDPELAGNLVARADSLRLERNNGTGGDDPTPPSLILPVSSSSRAHKGIQTSPESHLQARTEKTFRSASTQTTQSPDDLLDQASAEQERLNQLTHELWESRQEILQAQSRSRNISRELEYLRAQNPGLGSVAYDDASSWDNLERELNNNIATLFGTLRAEHRRRVHAETLAGEMSRTRQTQRPLPALLRRRNWHQQMRRVDMEDT